MSISFSPPFHMGVIRAICIFFSGKIPWMKELLNIYLSGCTVKSKSLLIALTDTSS